MQPHQRRILFGSLALLATALCFVLLHFASQPEKKKPKLPFADISALTPGHFLSVDTPSLRYYVVWPKGGELGVVAVPMRHGAVMMPEKYWWKPSTDCKDFGLNAANGQITTQTRFGCKDKDQPKEWAPRWQWNILGKHLPVDATKVDDMYPVRTERRKSLLVFVGLAPE